MAGKSEEFSTPSRAATRMKNIQSETRPVNDIGATSLGFWHSARWPAGSMGLAGQIASSDWFNGGKSESKSDCLWKRLYGIQTSLVSHASLLPN